MTPFSRRLYIKHRTEFVYAGTAGDSVNEIRLGPVDSPRQHVDRATVRITPTADVSESFDLWGNRVWWSQIVDHHDRLVIEAESVVDTGDPPAPSVPTVGRDDWLAVADPGFVDRWAEFLLPSDLVRWSSATRDFADGLGVSGETGIVGWVRALAYALNGRLIYERGATDVTTTVDGVIHAGRGVCQDFAHVFVALCRLQGLPARYVSGWLYEPDREGPVESHAWAEVYVPGTGWVEEDPTHVGEVSDRYVRIGCGRDYADVVPVKGTYLGAPTESMTVTVELRDVTVPQVGVALEGLQG